LNWKPFSDKMLQKFYKYHGAGNDFLLADNRDGILSLTSEQVRRLCDRHTGFGADGVMLLEKSESKDFRMLFFNPDGSCGMMCGNGGRCIVSFAADLGVVSGNYPVEFEAPDGLHTAIVERKASQELSDTRIIRLKMRDVEGILAIPEENAFFLNTGTRHLVKFVEGLGNYPVKEEGKVLRADPRFAPEGTNVNFVEPEDTPDGVVLHGRTFEKGVEDETLACGTGIVASAIAAYSRGILGKEDPTGRISYGIRAAIAGLSVDFLPEGSGEGFRASDVWLTGPATFVGTVEILL